MKVILVLCLVILFKCEIVCSRRISIDSLLNVANNNSSDTAKINALNFLADEFINTDSVRALNYIQKGILLAQKNNYNTGLADCYSKLADLYKSKKSFNDAVVFKEKSVKIYETKCKTNIRNSRVLAGYYLDLGNVYYAVANYPAAISNFQKALKLYEKNGDNHGVCKCYQNIGVAHSEQGNYKQSIEYYLLTLREYEKTGNREGIGICYLNIGVIYGMTGEKIKALDYLQKSLSIREKLDDKNGMADCYCNIGNVHFFDGKIENAIFFYKKTLQLYKDLNQKDKIALVLGNIAELNNSLKKYNEAIGYANRSLEIARATGSLEDIKANYNHLSTAYKGLKKFEPALEYFELYKSVCDSIFNIEKSKQISELEAVYQNEKKQKEIVLKESQLSKKEIEVKHQKTQKYAFFVGFALMLMLAVVILKSYKEKKKANRLLAKKNIEIEGKNEELNQQNEEIRTQRDKLNEQNILLEEQKQEITDSIRYAERIQKALLPEMQQVEMLHGASLLEFFILYRPKDIVSGDFYWTTQVNKWLIVTVADCTGHGVPGAFMSMLGISFLNEIVRKKEVTKASEVLDLLRASVIDALQQKGGVAEQKDGMDIAFCAINTETLEMQFAGANNPCWIVETCLGMSQQLTELRPDKMPIGIHDRMDPFTNHIHQLQKGDVIYLMSDGFEDQFGGPHRKKFLAKNLRNLLIANSQLPMTNQKQILETTITEWIGDGEQIDDVAILGFRV